MASKYFDKAIAVLEADIQRAPSENSEPEVSKPAPKPKKDFKTSEKKKESRRSKEPKDKTKKLRKKTGYKIYFDERREAIKNASEENKSKNYKEYTIPELSTIISKEWKEIGEDGQRKWNEKAEEFNIILEGIELPQKNQRKDSSSEISDTDSDDELITKKNKSS